MHHIKPYSMVRVMESTKVPQFTPGSAVRAAQQPTNNDDQSRSQWSRCSATVLTVSETDGKAIIIWNDMAPTPPPCSWFDIPAGDNASGSNNTNYRRRSVQLIQRPFLVTPKLDRSDGKEEEVPLSSLGSLLPFEQIDDNHTGKVSEASSFATTPSAFKEQGDALLRLRDYSAAATRYEAALALTSSIDLGGTIVLNDGTGRPVLAEIDCIEDNTQIDITFVGSGEEKTVQASKDVLLCLMEDDDERIQERILLNLSRCLLQLADIDGSVDHVRATKYRKAAVLGCTLALSCASYGKGLEGTEEKARLIRGGAYLDLGKCKHAVADAKQILKVNPNNSQAKKLLRDVERREAQKKRTDKRLAKDVCKWVNKATKTPGTDDVSVSDETAEGNAQSTASSGENILPRHVSSNSLSSNAMLIRILMVVVVAIAVKLWITGYETLQQAR